MNSATYITEITMNNKSNTPPHIATLGTRISGLAAAHECIKKGYRVTVYDKLPFY